MEYNQMIREWTPEDGPSHEEKENIFKKYRQAHESQKNRRRKDPADKPVGLNCHADGDTYK